MPDGPPKIDLPSLAGSPYPIQRSLEILREELQVALAQLRETRAKLDNLYIPTFEDIREQLGPTGQYPLPTAGFLNTEPPPTGPGPVPPVNDGIPDYLAIVQATATAFNITGASSDEEVFRFIQTVAQDINASGMNPAGIVCGLTLAPAAGSNVFTCAGITYRYARVCFSNGHLFKCLIDADPGGARTPEWADNGFDPGLYSPATDPSGPC